jgi:probable phosphoglycerate mutase
MTDTAKAVDLILIRHASTAWNEQGIYQGRQDIPLSPLGVTELSKISVPTEFRNWKIYSSPLQRAVQTALSLFQKSPELVEAAIEQDFGHWEGQLPKQGPDVGWTGLDLPIPGGESIRDVQVRMQAWLKDFNQQGQSAALVTHKGVILALISLAYNWDGHGKKPFKLDSKKIQHLQVLPDGKLAVVKLNMDFNHE